MNIYKNPLDTLLNICLEEAEFIYGVTSMPLVQRINVELALIEKLGIENDLLAIMELINPCIFCRNGLEEDLFMLSDCTAYISSDENISLVRYLLHLAEEPINPWNDYEILDGIRKSLLSMRIGVNTEAMEIIEKRKQILPPTSIINVEIFRDKRLDLIEQIIAETGNVLHKLKIDDTLQLYKIFYPEIYNCLEKIYI